MGFEIRPLSGSLGAEVLGLADPSALTEHEIQQLNQAWVGHGVLCLRDQPVEPAGLFRLARLGR